VIIAKAHLHINGFNRLHRLPSSCYFYIVWLF